MNFWWLVVGMLAFVIMAILIWVSEAAPATPTHDQCRQFLALHSQLTQLQVKEYAKFLTPVQLAQAKHCLRGKPKAR